MADRDDRIRELAYLLWLEEGYPEGQAERHWLTAEIMIDSEPRTKPRRRRAAREDEDGDQKKALRPA
jgi:Protein of unknown function (DUF2934)